MEKSMERHNKSKSWQHFTKKNDTIATCNYCQQDYRYKGTVSNLLKHLKRKHFTDSDSSGDEGGKTKKKSTRKSTWKYYDVLDSDKFVANCKICGDEVPYDSVSDLAKHIKNHGESPLESDEDELEEIYELPEVKKSNKRYSLTWAHFKDIDSEARLAACLLCKHIFSYASISNLTRHLRRKHNILSKTKDGVVKSDDILKQEVYEVQTTESNNDNSDDENVSEEMDIVYLEDFDDSLEEKQAFKSVNKTCSKPKSKKEPIKKTFEMVTQKEQVRKNTRTSDNEEIPVTKKPDPLDYFGQYVVSLLRELPKNISDQLQSEIVKQIISAKVLLDAPENTIVLNNTSSSIETSEKENQPLPETSGEIIITSQTCE